MMNLLLVVVIILLACIRTISIAHLVIEHTKGVLHTNTSLFNPSFHEKYIQNLLTVVGEYQPIFVLESLFNSYSSTVPSSRNTSLLSQQFIATVKIEISSLRRIYHHIRNHSSQSTHRETDSSNATVPFQFPVIDNQFAVGTEINPNQKTSSDFWRSMLNRAENEFFAQDQEDRWLFHNLFFGRTNGVILESGALNGVLFSTSHFFEKHLNWTTIHIEADPFNAEQLRKLRVQAINIKAALCDSERVLHYVIANNANKFKEGAVRGIFEFMTTNFTKVWYPELLANASAVLTYPEIACVPLKYILSAIDVKHIDVWVLDVEGAEEKALLGADFSMVQIDTILVESDGKDPNKDKRALDLLQGKGYSCTQVMRNSVCIHDSFRPRISSLASHKEDIYKAFNGTSVMVHKISKKRIFYVDYSTLRRFGSYARYNDYLQHRNGTPYIVLSDNLAALFTMIE